MKNKMEQVAAETLSDDDLLALVYENELIIGKIEQQLEEQLRIMEALGVEKTTLENVKKVYGYTKNEENKVRQMIAQLDAKADENAHHQRAVPMPLNVSASNDKVNERVKRNRARSFI